jgi:ERCC4-type nuclease
MLEITIDSREQTPWAFDSTLVHATRGTVRTGDYCVKGDKGFSIERKSLNDFLGTISTGWERFQREIYRAKDAGYNMPIIVEARFSDLLFAV